MEEDAVAEEIRNRIREAFVEAGLLVSGRLLLLTDKRCLGCEAVKEMLKEELESGAAVEIDVESEEGKELCERFGIEEVPTIILDTGKELRKCEIRTEGDDLVIECEEGGESDKEKMGEEERARERVGEEAISESERAEGKKKELEED